jgi:hypothetical protein
MNGLGSVVSAEVCGSPVGLELRTIAPAATPPGMPAG